MSKTKPTIDPAERTATGEVRRWNYSRDGMVWAMPNDSGAWIYATPVALAGPALLAQLEAFVEFANEWFGEGQMPADWKGRCVCANAVLAQTRGTA